VEALTSSLELPGLQHAMQELTRSSQALQAMVMQIRMIPVDVVFLRFPRLVRDLSSKLGKEVKLDLVGSETELDRTVVDALGDPLVHLVRNSLDHGIERPADRIAAGKPAQATVGLSAVQEPDAIVIDVIDDGRGIDPETIKLKAYERGLITEQQLDTLSDQDAVNLVFLPGFSTADSIS
jgi:two-component system chemotaxis sensor kinase CheA